MKLKHGPLAVLAAISLAGSASATTVLLADNFNSASYGVSTFNNTLAADQSGTIDPITYTVGGYTADWQIQHGNSQDMIMAAFHEGARDLYVSLDHNFAGDANTADQPLQLQFDLKITNAASSDDWSTFAIGSAQNAFVNNAANKFSSLFRFGGGTQQFASGSNVTIPISWTPTGSTISVILSDTAGTGSAFDGSGSVAKMFINGNLQGSWTLGQLGSGDGFVNFESNAAFGHYDNLSVSLIPEPGAALLGSLGALALLRRRRSF